MKSSQQVHEPRPERTLPPKREAHLKRLERKYDRMRDMLYLPRRLRHR